MVNEINLGQIYDLFKKEGKSSNIFNLPKFNLYLGIDKDHILII